MRAGKVPRAECCVSSVEKHRKPFGLGVVVYPAEHWAFRCCIPITPPDLEGLNLLLVLLREIDGGLPILPSGLYRNHRREHPPAPCAQRNDFVVWKGDISL